MADMNAETVLGALGLQKQGASGAVAPVVGAFIVGGLIGAGIALLFAPKAGEELRSGLGQRVDEALESNEDLLSEYGKPGKNDRESHTQRAVAPTAGSPGA